MEENIIQTKVCKCCGKEKPLSEFTKDKRQKDGHHSRCKECKRAADRERYAKVKNDPKFHARKLEHGAKYRMTHQEQIQKYSNEYNLRPEVIERKSTWYQEKMANMSMKERLDLMVRRAKYRAELKNVPFDITSDDIEFVETCPLLEIKLNWGETTNEGGRNIDTPSLDRIDPSLGYIKGNVRIISLLANMMKTSANRSQLETFYKNIWKYLDREDIVRTTENLESVELQDKEPVS